MEEMTSPTTLFGLSHTTVYPIVSAEQVAADEIKLTLRVVSGNNFPGSLAYLLPTDGEL